MDNQNNNNIEFFTREDFTILEKWAGREYNSDYDVHQRAKEKLKEGPWEKTKYWCEEVAKRTGLKAKTSKIWHKQAGPGKLEFRPYAWARLYEADAFTDEIYFTVGLAAHEKTYLHYKIDRQFQSPKYLNDEQLEKARDHIIGEEGHYLYQKKLLVEDLEKYNWGKLIDETVQFIQNHKAIYHRILRVVEESSVAQKFTRVCWNSNGWTEPSGRDGKSKSKQSFEGITGFGFEEWIFSEELNNDGYQHGFIQGINQDPPDEKILNLDLYTIQNTKNGRRTYWVASIKHAEILDVAEAKSIEEELAIKNLIHTKIRELNSDIDVEKVLESYLNGPFINIRFSLSDVIFPTDEYHTEIDLDINRFNRYKLFNGSLWDQLNSNSTSEETQDEYGLGEVSFSRSSNRTSTVHRSAGSHEMHRKHDEISEKLEAFLKQIKNDGETVTPESGRKDGRAIDMVHLKGREATLYEIKTYPSIRRTIRDGLGQLLEYAYWGNPYEGFNLTLVVVGMEKPGLATQEYLEYLRSSFELRVYYQHFDLEQEKLGNRV